MSDPRPEHLTIDSLETPIGVAMVVTDGDGVLRAFDWVDHEPRLRALLARYAPGARHTSGAAPAAIRKAFKAYFAGEVGALASVRWKAGGTAFQESAWSALCEIPAGQTYSYGQQAQAMGAPRAVRAVGRANGANPVAVVVPCHRVIGADGTLTGYGGGLDRKRWLLRHEGAAFREP